MTGALQRFSRDMSLGAKNLLLHKLRSFLTMLGLVFGVGSVIAMLAIGEGASQEALERIRHLGSTNILLTSRKPSDDETKQQKLSPFSIYGLLYADADRLAATIPTIETVVPVKMFQKQGRLHEHTQDLRVVCTSADWFSLVSREVVAGRTFGRDDVESFAAVAVLTEWGARRLLANEHAVGETLTIDRNAYRVIGVVRSEASGPDAKDSPDRQTDVYIPLSTARQRHGDLVVRKTNGSMTREKVELHEILARVRDERSVEATSHAIQRLLETSHRRADYEVDVPLRLLREAEATKRTFAIVLGAIAGISLLVGGIGIMNIMLASVTERTREIGIRRAIGARRFQIVTQFLIEAVILSVAGGLIGLLLGLAIPFVVTLVAGMPTVVTVSSLVLSLGISVGIGVGFGIYPAIRASKLDPIVALRFV